MLAASSISLVLLLDPYILRGISNARVHTGLPLMMFGAAGLFMHGLGFRADNIWVRAVFHSLLAWLFYAAGILIMAGVV